jgi:hypothetical protein
VFFTCFDAGADPLITHGHQDGMSPDARSFSSSG